MERNYKLIDTIGIIGERSSGGVSLQLQVIEWNGRKARFDLRNWKLNPDGSEIPYKGLTMTTKQLSELRDLLNRMDFSAEEDEIYYAQQRLLV